MNCNVVQQSLRWCQGQANYSGIRGQLLYTAVSNIVSWPKRKTSASGAELAEYNEAGGDSSSFVFRADTKFNVIDILSAKSKVTSDPNGEFPSGSQLNKIEAVIPTSGVDAANLAASINNIPCIWIYRDMEGKYRVVGCQRWASEIKNTIATDSGTGAAGSAQSTLTIEAPDTTPPPAYFGSVDVVDEDA